ncbi:MAG: Hpt domain-containing protein, partial [Chitinophagales bacterium]
MEPSLINLRFLESFTNGDTAKMKKYINMFIQSAPDAINQMKQLHAAGNWNQLRTVAHSLKPQLGYMGIDTVKELILRIEEYAGEGKKTDIIAQMITELESTCIK